MRQLLSNKNLVLQEITYDESGRKTTKGNISIKLFLKSCYEDCNLSSSWGFLVDIDRFSRFV